MSFLNLNIDSQILKTLEKIGYKTPSPIQMKIIPYILKGRDVIGQAQTGTGKTAAFALPILSKINLHKSNPQVLVLVPTRELAIQISSAFSRYGEDLKGLYVTPIYGGQDYNTQLRALKKGVQVVVGTPGRIIDHIRKNTLNLSGLNCLVLDEADEILRMGFIDDIKWILKKIPTQRQTALFSATMPPAIEKIAQQYLNNPQKISIAKDPNTAHHINQRYCVVSGLQNKNATLDLLLEAEESDAVIIFARTKKTTIDIADRLTTRGYAATALNGDMPQSQRERTITELKSGKIKILVATDVAARGLDVARITHVINYDIPFDIEAYIHRIGRTGRAGLKGFAILFVASREKNMLRNIERAIKQKIQLMTLPSLDTINKNRIKRFKQRISDQINAQQNDFYSNLIQEYKKEVDFSDLEIAAALAQLAQGDQSLLLTQTHTKNMDRYRIEVGRVQGAQPGKIVNAITRKKIGLDKKSIGKISIKENFSIIDLPVGLSAKTFHSLSKIWFSDRPFKISKIENCS